MKVHWPRFSRTRKPCDVLPPPDLSPGIEVATAPTGEFLSFSLGNREYGVDINRVQEIRGYDLVTRVADAPAFLQGVIDLRGVRVPVVDLRDLQAPEQWMPCVRRHAAFGEFSVMIVLNVSAQLIGMVVDGVSDVMLCNDDHVAPQPEPRMALIDRFISGVGGLGERMLRLVDIERLVSSLDLPHLRLLAERTH